MADEDGPLIAKEVYTDLFRSQDESSLFRSDIIHRRIPQNPENRDSICHSRAEGTETDLSAEHTETIRTCGMSTDQMATEAESSASGSLHLLRLPEIVDRISRKLRAQGAPASRWATFIHIGV